MVRNHTMAAVPGLTVSDPTQHIHVLFTAMDFVVCKSGALLFLSKFGLQDIALL